MYLHLREIDICALWSKRVFVYGTVRDLCCVAVCMVSQNTAKENGLVCVDNLPLDCSTGIYWDSKSFKWCIMPSPCSVYDVMERKSCEWVGEYMWECESERINEWHQNNMICCRVLVIKMYYNFRFIKCKDTAIIVSQTKHFDIHVLLNFTATHSSYHDGIVKFNPNSGQVYLCPNVHACTGIWISWLIVFVTLDYNCNVNPHVFVFIFTCTVSKQKWV